MSPFNRLVRPARLLQAAALVSAAILAGCVDQQQEVNAYRKVLDNTHPPAVRVDYSHGEELTLEGALLLANSGSEQLSIQGETYLQSLIARDRAYAAFMPTLSLAPTLSFQNKPFANGGSNISTGSTSTGTTVTGTGSTGTTGTTGTGTLSTGSSRTSAHTTNSVPLSSHMNVFNGFRDVSTLQGAQFNTKVQRYTLLNLQATVLLETAQVYYNVLLAEESVTVLANSVSYQEALVQDQRNRMRVGLAQPLDVAQSEAQAAATRASLVTAQDNVLTSRAMLTFFTNAQTDKAALVDRLEIPEKLPTVDETVRQAEVQRLDILAAAEQVRVQQQTLETAVHEYIPSVSLDLNYYLHRSTFPTNVEWAGIFTATVPIFSAGEIRADIRNAMSTLRQSVYNEWQLIRQVRENVTIDWDNLMSSRKRITELEAETAAAQEALRQARERYGAGLAINLDVLNATTQLLTSQLSLAQERFNAKVFYLELLRDSGKMPLPSSVNSMSSATTQPALQEVAPYPSTVPGAGSMLPGGMIAPQTQPAGASATTQPNPATQPTTAP